MKNFCDSLHIIGILLVVMLPVIWSFSKDFHTQLPVLKHFEVDKYNNMIKPYFRVEGNGSVLVVEKLKHLRLECHANHPVQFIYTGNGVCESIFFNFFFQKF